MLDTFGGAGYGAYAEDVTMRFLVHWGAIAMITLTPVQTLAGPVEDGAAAIDRWVAAYNAADLEGLMKAYAPDAILQGTSEPQINVGTDDLRKYFKRLPQGSSSVSIQERRMVVINDTAVLGVGFYTFKGGPARFSFLTVKRGDGWVIQHHHSSSIPKGRD
jgi:hypothetical protein